MLRGSSSHFDFIFAVWCLSFSFYNRPDRMTLPFKLCLEHCSNSLVHKSKQKRVLGGGELRARSFLLLLCDLIRPSISFRFPFDFPSISLRSPFDLPSISLRPAFDRRTRALFLHFAGLGYISSLHCCFDTFAPFAAHSVGWSNHFKLNLKSIFEVIFEGSEKAHRVQERRENDNRRRRRVCVSFRVNWTEI